jgi:hypothetical protein
MAIVLTHNVDVFDAIMQIAGNPAVIELNDDDTFVLARRDPATGAKGEVIMNVPLSQLTVRGSQAVLAFTANGLTKRVDFSAVSRAVGMAGVAGMIAQAAIVNDSGIKQWIETLRMRGVTVKYARQGRRTLISLGVVVVILIVVVVAVTITALGAPQ